jgi:hypothetical protein
MVFVSLIMVAFRDTWAVERGRAARPSDAFAVIAAETVKGGYHQYPPFYSNVIAPHAVVDRGKVYCAFQNSKGQPIVMTYDISEKRWSEPAKASQFGLGRDAHGNPSICIDRRGYIHIFYGCHGRAMRHTRSSKPYDITAWQEQSAPTSWATYPQSMRMANNDINLFYRAGGHVQPWSLRISADDGQSWSEPQKIIEMRLEPHDPLAAAYCSFHPGSGGKTVHCFWVHKDDNAARVKGNKKHPWRPLKHKGLHEASGDEFTNTGFPAVDSKDRPYVRFRYGVGDWKKGTIIVPWRHKFAYYDSRNWRVTDEVPQKWPSNAKTVLTARGPAAYGDISNGHWFIFFQYARHSKDAGSFIFLYHEKTGYATREGGPASVE